MTTPQSAIASGSAAADDGAPGHGPEPGGGLPLPESPGYPERESGRPPDGL